MVRLGRLNSLILFLCVCLKRTDGTTTTSAQLALFVPLTAVADQSRAACIDIIGTGTILFTAFLGKGTILEPNHRTVRLTRFLAIRTPTNTR